MNTKAPEEGSGSKSASLKSTTVNVDVNRHWFPCIDPISHSAADPIVWRARSDHVDCHEMVLQVLRGRGTAINTTDTASAGGRGCQGKNTTTLAQQSIKGISNNNLIYTLIDVCLAPDLRCKAFMSKLPIWFSSEKINMEDAPLICSPNKPVSASQGDPSVTHTYIIL